jgi:hypothetical protein
VGKQEKKRERSIYLKKDAAAELGDNTSLTTSLTGGSQRQSSYNTQEKKGCEKSRKI